MKFSMGNMLNSQKKKQENIIIMHRKYLTVILFRCLLFGSEIESM